MNANTYVDRPNDKGTALDRERQLATLLEDDDVLCAMYMMTVVTQSFYSMGVRRTLLTSSARGPWFTRLY